LDTVCPAQSLTKSGSDQRLGFVVSSTVVVMDEDNSDLSEECMNWLAAQRVLPQLLSLCEQNQTLRDSNPEMESEPRRVWILLYAFIEILTIRSHL
jgi:hypothetical protein